MRHQVGLGLRVLQRLVRLVGALVGPASVVARPEVPETTRLAGVDPHDTGTDAVYGGVRRYVDDGLPMVTALRPSQES